MAVTQGKIVIIGMGHVGSAILYRLIGENIAREIVLIDIDRSKALGEALDVKHMLALESACRCEIHAGDYKDCADAQVIINAAGAASAPDENCDRMALLETNLKIADSVMANITRRTKEAIVVGVTNPVDILTWYCQTKYDYPREKVFSTGTLLDTARMRKLLGEHLRIDPRSITGFVLGEHGDTAFIPWNTVNVAGIPLDRFEEQFGLKKPIDREELIRAVKASAQEILSRKGYTSAGVAQAACLVVRAIVTGSRSVFPLSVSAKGEYGLERVAMSLPCVVGEKGIERVLILPLLENGERAMRACDDYLRSVIADIDVEKVSVTPRGYLGGFPPQHTNPACIGKPVS